MTLIIGCGLIDRIFDYNGIIIEQIIKEDIINAVTKYEPRIIMRYNDIVIVQDTQTVNIYINYIIKETGEINEFNIKVTADDNPNLMRN